MRKLLLGIFIIVACNVFSQFDAQLSQYMLHNNAYNPAAVGMSNLIEITGQHRLNMIDMPGGGSTTVFSVNTPLKTGKLNHGIGLRFLNDQVGWFSNKAFQLQYAYKTKLAGGNLSVGTDIGLVTLGFSGDSLSASTISLGTYHNFSGDNAIPQTGVVGSGLDLGFGLWYNLDNWYTGVSFVHANKPTVKWGMNNVFSQYSMLYLTGGLTLNLENPKYVIKPSALIKSDFSSWQFDLSSRFEYDQRFWGGVSLRPFNSLVLMGGVNIAGGLSISYSFDVATSRLITTNYGSHEILLSYSFEYVFSKQQTKQKSIRYL